MESILLAVKAAGAWFSKYPVTDQETSDGVFGSGSLRLLWGHCGMQGWRDRMEDAFIARERPPFERFGDSSIFAVMDGHGGEEVALFCQKHLPDEIGRCTVADEKEAMRRVFHRMDERLRAGFRPDVDIGRVGCTAVVCLVSPHRILVANAGDSRAVLSRRGGKAVALSRDHKPDLPGERMRIELAGGRVTEQRVAPGRSIWRVDGQLSVSRAIGDLNLKNPRFAVKNQKVTCDPDVQVFPRQDDDEFMVLACDGVWDVLSNQQVVDYVREHLPALHEGRLRPSQVVGALLNRCLSDCPEPQAQGIGTDNMSMVLVIFPRSVGDVVAAVPRPRPWAPVRGPLPLMQPPQALLAPAHKVHPMAPPAAHRHGPSPHERVQARNPWHRRQPTWIEQLLGC